MKLKQDDKIKLFSKEKLFELFEKFKTFSSTELRQEAAERLSEKEGIVKSCYLNDIVFQSFFCFQEENNGQSWYIPYQAVNFDFNNI